jgi:thiamine-phosphate pyrophosphorylase
MAGLEPSGPERLSRLAGLYAIVGGADAVAQAEAAVAGGAGAVQVRMKAALPGEVLEVARRIVALARGRALVLVNDRADLALLAGADGVHVGGEDLPVAEARRLLGPERLVGWTATSLAQAREGVARGADHVGFGPVFPSRTKSMGVPAAGIAGLGEVVAGLAAPVVAISGITLENVADVAAAGAAAAAVIEALFGAGDARRNAADLSRAFAAGRARRTG